MEAVKEKVQLQKYPAYKDSGVEWLGEIPEHWKIVRMKFLYNDYSEKNRKDAELLSVTQDKGVVPRSWVENRMVMPSGNLESFKYIQKGDFAISLRSFEGGLEYCHHDGIISPAYTVLKQRRNDLKSSYYKYLFKSHSFISELQTSVVGIREGKNISFNELSYSLMPIPKPEEQTAIATFLDEKCGKIDTAIAQKEKLIGLLKERKQIIIQNAVTKGLNPEAKMKDSGVEWIGEIPEHWEVKKIKHVTNKIGSGVTPSGGGTTYLDDGIPLLRSQNVHFGNIDLEGAAKISQAVHDSMSNSKVERGDVLLNITGGSIGRCHYVETDEPINVNQHVCIVRPNKLISTNFLNALLASEIGQGQIWFFQQGGGREGLNFQALKNFDIPYPPKNEQRKILNFLEDQVKKIDQTILLQQQQIEKLKEYKSSLIDAAVTGKIKVS
ncbi:restriction endonuclease subunit S [Salinimicrobium sp. 3283s]|uniref:restriction endonuclease subunit S n=1 Tax=Salinimicrobium sp. 3283s TaxID=3114359 RepID=UPI0031EB12C8